MILLHEYNPFRQWATSIFPCYIVSSSTSSFEIVVCSLFKVRNTAFCISIRLRSPILQCPYITGHWTFLSEQVLAAPWQIMQTARCFIQSNVSTEICLCKRYFLYLASKIFIVHFEFHAQYNTLKRKLFARYRVECLLSWTSSRVSQFRLDLCISELEKLYFQFSFIRIQER